MKNRILINLFYHWRTGHRTVSENDLWIALGKTSPFDIKDKLDELENEQLVLTAGEIGPLRKIQLTPKGIKKTKEMLLSFLAQFEKESHKS